ncbi:uncharacterized protein TNCV_2791571 [Trichonephila clavipes]|nr:uncharacterized protein TNCV_2791571 [Trichonephila clavipes]
MDQGIIERLKRIYMKQVLRRLFLTEYEKESVADFAKTFNMKVACYMEEITYSVQSIPLFQECDEEDVETWMACNAEDCGFQMLNDGDIVTSVQEEFTLSTMKRMKSRTTTITKVARVHQMLTRFLR